MLQRNKKYKHITFCDFELIFHCEGCSKEQKLYDKEPQRQAEKFANSHKDC